jgi:aconitate hydratase
VLPDIRRRMQNGDKEIPVQVNGSQIMAVLDVSDRQRKHLLAGGTLNDVKEQLRSA